MPAFVGWIIKPILEWIGGKIIAAIQLWEKDRINHQNNVDQSAQDMQKAKDLKKDASAKETDEAIDDAFKHL